MEIAGTESVAGKPVVARTIADPDVTAGNFQQHESEVLGTHAGLHPCLHPLRSDDALHDPRTEFGLPVVVDRGRIHAFKIELSLAIHGDRGVLRDLAHAPLDQIKGFKRERAHRTPEHGFVGDDVIGASGVYLRDAEHGGIQRITVAGDDGLQ